MQDINALEGTQQGLPQGAGQQNAGDSVSGQVEPGVSRPEATPDTHGRSQGSNPDFARRRWEGKLSDRLSALEGNVTRIVDALSQQPHQSQAPSASQAPDLWTDHEGYLSARENRLRSELTAQMDGVRQQAKIDVETRMARDYIKSQVGNDPDMYAEVEQIGVANGYHYISPHDPVLAAEKAVDDWKAWKAQQRAKETQPANGLFNGQQQAPSRAAAMAVNGSAVSGGRKQWNAEEIAQARREGNYAKYRDEILAANKQRLGL